MSSGFALMQGLVDNTLSRIVAIASHLDIPPSPRFIFIPTIVINTGPGLG